MDGSTLLLTAVSGGHADVAKFLLHSGADMDGDASKAALILCCACIGELDAFSQLLSHLADPFPKASESLVGMLDRANDAIDLDLIKMLVARGANPSAPAIGEMTPLVAAACSGRPDVVEYFLELDATVMSTDYGGSLALAGAGLSGSVAVARLLVDHGAPVNLSRPASAYAPLMVGAFFGREAIVEFLLQHGAKVNAAAHDGKTALMLAAAADKPKVVETLLEHDANVHAKDREGRTALRHAAQTGSCTSAAILLEQGARWNGTLADGSTGTMDAATGGCRELVRLAVAEGNNVNATGPQGVTALMKAAANGHLDVVALLAAEGADLDHKDARMKTARDYAATHGHSPVVLFLAAQADRPALQDSPESS